VTLTSRSNHLFETKSASNSYLPTFAHLYFPIFASPLRPPYARKKCIKDFPRLSPKQKGIFLLKLRFYLFPFTRSMTNASSQVDVSTTTPNLALKGVLRVLNYQKIASRWTKETPMLYTLQVDALQPGNVFSHSKRAVFQVATLAHTRIRCPPIFSPSFFP